MRYKGNILEVNDLCLSLSNADGAPVKILNNLKFNVRSGEILGLIGDSGSGKTMTALAVSGLLSDFAHVDSGEIIFEGEDLVKKTPKERRLLLGEKIGVIFQDPSSALDPLQTVESNLSEIISIRDGDKSKGHERILNMLKTVGFDDPKQIAKRYPHRLSGGQRQRVLIAGAALMNPSLLIADEPTSSLDTVTSMSIMQLLHEMCQEMGISILFISHNLNTVRNFCDRVMVMKEGTIIDADTSWDIMGQPKSAFTAELLMKSKLDPHALGITRGEARENAASVLTAKSICAGYKYAGFTNDKMNHVVNNVDFDILEGECVGLIGSSGCGKTTLVKSILGLIKPSSGIIEMNGRIAAVFQDPVSSLNPAHTVRWHLAEALRASGRKMTREEQKPYFLKILEDVGLEGKHLNRFPHQMSGGQRQKAAIAMCLVQEPAVIIADEPFSALDASSQASVIKLLSDINANRGTTMLIVSHNLLVIKAMCSKVLVMDKGRIVESGNTDEVLENPKAEATHALLKAGKYAV
ncbi:MAG: ABC transporter ATP-binding protein [Clostridiales bacterium]|nr:ABC transporter ATP-binding protein [Clostridiales bacterium]MBP3811232.1 ABC transporter ATP-binding protein [Clostridiales bacterium]